jgi:hypothetical protein
VGTKIHDQIPPSVAKHTSAGIYASRIREKGHRRDQDESNNDLTGLDLAESARGKAAWLCEQPSDEYNVEGYVRLLSCVVAHGPTHSYI